MTRVAWATDIHFDGAHPGAIASFCDGLAKAGRLGDESAAHLRRVLPPALERYEHVVVLTHVPPFQEASWHEGHMGSDEFLPYFACQATGEALREQASRNPQRRLTVLCGHTHSSGEIQPLPNLRVLTGAARYGSPAPQPPLDL